MQAPVGNTDPKSVPGQGNTGKRLWALWIPTTFRTLIVRLPLCQYPTSPTADLRLQAPGNSNLLERSVPRNVAID
jgi:hypothetical protein